MTELLEKIAAMLTALEHCSERTAVQCREKIKSDYKQAKDNNNRLGRGTTICAFYNQLDAILGCRPSSTPSSVIGSMPATAEDSVCIGDGAGEDTRQALDSATSGRAMEEEEENDDDLGPSFQGMCNDLLDVAIMRCCTTPQMRARV